MLDARFDAVCNSSIVADLVTAANIEGTSGVYEIVTTAMSVSRVERTMSLLVTGLVATADMSVMSEVLQVIVRTQHSSKSTAHLSASTLHSVPAWIMTCQSFLSSGFLPYPLSPGLAVSALVCFDFAFHLLSSVVSFSWPHLYLAFRHVQTISTSEEFCHRVHACLFPDVYISHMN